jgi:hypothetical protein
MRRKKADKIAVIAKGFGLAAIQTVFPKHAVTD